MIARLIAFAFLGICISSTATAGNYSWGTVASPSRIAGADLTGSVSVQTPAGTNGALQQYHIPADGLLRTKTLAQGKQTDPDPPNGSRVSGGRGKLGWITGALAVGPSYHGTKTIEGGTVYFSGSACTEDWKCRYGVYMRTCKDDACSAYLIPAETVGFPYSDTKDGWTQNIAASLDGWVFFLRLQQEKITGNKRTTEIWARNVRSLVPAMRLANNSVGGISLSDSGDLELVPGLAGQLTVVIPGKGSAAIYVPEKGWRPLP